MSDLVKLNTLIVRFANKINTNEIPLFRGAIIDAVGTKNHLLFHNHQDEGYRYGYPLIQYKRIQQCAAIVCVGEGVDEIGSLFASSSFNLRIGRRQEQFTVDRVIPQQINVQIWQSSFLYRLRGWLPFNSENYNAYQQLDSLGEKIKMLEGILTGNMLSFCKSIGYTAENQLSCSIVNIEEPKVVRYKGILTTCFDLQFKTNLSLPDYIGLGKGVSLGHGIVTQMRQQQAEVKKKQLFLLGGGDLEMYTISQLLKNNGITVEDRDLTWATARTSAYADIFDKYPPSHCDIYGVELAEDCALPSNYHRIDHHGTLPNYPSSLDQVCNLLNIVPDRWLQLVSANDAAYIPGMRRLDATQQEIEKVRSLDRQYQGVTAFDETAADLAMVNCPSDRLTVVFTKAQHFSPIVDRLYPFQRLLVYNDSELTYYGEDCKQLAAHFARSLKNGKMYSGGGSNGYFGISYDDCTPARIQSFVDLIIHLMK